MNWVLLKNSFLVAGLTTGFSLGLGFLSALCLATLPRRWQRGGLALAVLALILPPFLVTNCWLDLLGQTGRWRSWAPFQIYSLGGTIWILTLLHWPITALLAQSAWTRLESSQLEQDPALRGPALIRWLLWPMAAKACGLAAVLTLVLTLNHFAVPALLQVKVLPASLWVQFNTTFQHAEALRIGWPLWIGPVLLLAVWRYGAIAWPTREGRASPTLIGRQLGFGWTGLARVVFGSLAVLSVALPVLQLGINERTWSELSSVVRTATVPTWNSFWLAYLTAAISLGVALLVWRWRWGVGFWLTFLGPGLGLGIGISLLFNLPVLHWFRQSLGIVVLAWTLRFMAPAWLVVRHAIRNTDRDLRDLGRLSGASRWAMIREVYWPQIGAQALAAAYLIYLFCLWDVETLIVIVPPGGETLALRIFNLLHYGHNAQVNALCLVLMGLALAPPAGWLVARWLKRTLFAHA